MLLTRAPPCNCSRAAGGQLTIPPPRSISSSATGHASGAPRHSHLQTGMPNCFSLSQYQGKFWIRPPQVLQDLYS